MKLPIDAYSLRARLFPALLAFLPAFSLIATSTTWREIQPSTLIAGLAAGILLYAASQYAGRKGRLIEPGLFERMGGKPTTRMLRHRTNELNPLARDRIHSFLAARTGLKAPTAEGERNNPMMADAFYEAVAAWLRENTRDIKIYHLLFEQNVSYGFYRNLYALKPMGLTANLLTVLLAAGIAYYQHIHGMTPDRTALTIVFCVALGHAIYFIFAVDEDSVREASDLYSRQLLLSAEQLAGPAPAGG